MREFFNCFAMGDYSYYIWSAYGLVTLILIINTLSIKLGANRLRKRLQSWFQRQN